VNLKNVPVSFSLNNTETSTDFNEIWQATRKRAANVYNIVHLALQL